MEDPSLSFMFADPEALPAPMLQLDECHFTYSQVDPGAKAASAAGEGGASETTVATTNVI